MSRWFQALLVLVLVLSAAGQAAAGATFYGYIKLDASYDATRTNDGNFAYIVLPYAEGEEDDEFNMTAKQTRLGVKFDGPKSDSVDASGRIEFDFYGGGSENKPNPMLRHAYLELKTKHVDILAGQTSDVISPIVPTTLNYIVLWKSGDVGYRRPQIRLSKALKVADDAKLKLAVAATRSMGRGDDGETVGTPALQGRVALAAKLFGEGAAEIGVSGLMGREEATYASEARGDETYELDQTCVAVDVTLPLGDMVALKGQYFTGKNLAQYLGGIGQGIAEVQTSGTEETRNVEPVEIEATGWWAQLTVTPTESWQFNVGAGVDDPELPDGDTANDLEKNTTYYGNAIWQVAPSASIGVEYAMFETEYCVGGEEARAEGSTESYENTRLQLSLTYKF
ncbi:MAG: porin [Candidatus Eisenbacteria bacterium]